MNQNQPQSTGSRVPAESIERKILYIRDKKVMLDRDLAILYGVTTGNLNKAVKRNIDRFPENFMFQLNKNEMKSLRFQFGISNQGRGGRRYPPYAFTQEGIALLSSVLGSKRAIHINLHIMRTFVRLRELMISHKNLAQKIEHLEHKFKQHDKNFMIIFESIKKLLDSPEKPKNKIGFHT